MTEVELVELADQTLWLPKIKDADFPAIIQHAMDLAKPFVVVRKVAETEGRGYKIELRILERKVQRIGFDPLHRATAGLQARSLEHRRGEINARNRCCIDAGLAIECERHVSRATT